MVLPNLALAFPMLSSLPSPPLYAAPGHLGPKVWSLHGRCNLASASVGNEPIEPLPFSLFSSIKSRPLAKLSSLSLGLNEVVLVVGNPDSRGMTASAP